MTLIKRTLTWIVLLVAIGPSLAAERFAIAITVDDLTGSGALPPGTTRLAIAQSYLRTLKTGGVPEAYGFVNAETLKRDEDGAAVLDAWRQEKYPLGNHSYSHMGLDSASSLEQWEADVTAGEPEIERRMQGANWHYFRYPYLNGGSDQTRHDGALAFLKGRGYRVADVSVSFNDWAYSDAYSRCLAKGDSAAIATMKVQYFKGVDDGIQRMKALSQKVYGRMISQVLLTHLGGWSALTMKDVLAKLDAAGARYVTLRQAQRDPAYSEPDPRAADGILLERAANRRQLDIGSIPQLKPIDNLKALCQ
jgi:peptidoglycan/xylan/chitin deacetylase (PgdA/CDA1 family)